MPSTFSSRNAYPSFSLVLTTAKGVMKLKDYRSAISREVHLHLPVDLLPHSLPSALAPPGASPSSSSSSAAQPSSYRQQGSTSSSRGRDPLLTTIDARSEGQVDYSAAYGGVGEAEQTEDLTGNGHEGRAGVNRAGYFKLRRLAAIFVTLYRKLRLIGATVASEEA